MDTRKWCLVKGISGFKSGFLEGESVSLWKIFRGSYPCPLKVEYENQPLICSKEKLQLHFADAQRHPSSELTEQGSPNSFTEGLQSLKTNERLETKKLDHREAAPGQGVIIIYIYLPGTQMTLVLIGKGLVLAGWASKNGGHLGSRYIYIYPESPSRPNFDPW